MAQRTLQQWFDEYGESHRNKTNKLIHWICVPSIFFSIVCLLYQVPVAGALNLASISMMFATFFYIRLSSKLAAGLLLFYLLCYAGAHLLSELSVPLWKIALTIFVVAWIGQFFGHKIEGKKPSFLQDIQFLLIGPAWLMGFVYNKLGISLKG
ncbi:MAG: Mpo1-like protein [Bacteroidota bacterium]